MVFTLSVQLFHPKPTLCWSSSTILIIICHEVLGGNNNSSIDYSEQTASVP
jgi:hypothetical protein